MKINPKVFPLVVLLLLLFNACTEPISTSIMKKDLGGDLRGARIGDNKESIKKIEMGTDIMEEGDDFLYYYYPLNDSDGYTVEYFFDKDELYQIDIDVKVGTPQLAEDFYNDYMDYFKAKYGKDGVMSTDRYMVWTTKNESSSLIEIGITNDSEKRGYVSIFASDLDF